ncbi:hypothetical protein I4U23_030193 [Adineta vaga]|nr:hypothetical protein I4U23_030193 [Adineta vaga]
MLTIVILCLIGITVAQQPRPCVSPSQWEGRIFDIIEDIELSDDEFVYDVLTLYDSGLQFIYDLKSHSCTRTPVTYPWRDYAIPSMHIPLPDTGVLITIWGGNITIPFLNVTLPYIATWTYKACLPISRTVYSEKFGNEITSFYDITAGISDPNVFIPRRECLTAREYNIQGYLGCTDPLVPCLNATDCIPIKDVCVTRQNCIDLKSLRSVCKNKYCKPNSGRSKSCVTEVNDKLKYECISETKLCNKRFDCIDHSDETDRVCHGEICEEDEFRCPTGACILEKEMCDGTQQCSDGYDERKDFCRNKTMSQVSSLFPENNDTNSSSKTYECAPSAFFTQSIYLLPNLVCDGYQDCPMGDDENDCKNDKCDSKSICSTNSDIICIKHPVVKELCRCKKPGYEIAANLTLCQDFNECNDSVRDYCSFECTNTDGSFDCSCPSKFNYDQKTKTCQRKNDVSTPYLLAVLKDNINFYDISNSTDQYSAKLISTSNIDSDHHFDYIQYDPVQMFVIYYDQIQQAVLCKANDAPKAIILLSNLTLHGFVYNANEKSLFVIENQSKTLRMYAPIACDVSINIKMHSWTMNDLSNSIHSMEIDIYRRQLIFASKTQFMISSMSEPNSTKIVHNAHSEIKRFIYDSLFKRIFWTTNSARNDGSFPVHTCDDQFKQCHDTYIPLPHPWPFGFFNDDLLHTSSHKKHLISIQLYGTRRSFAQSITSTQDEIRSFLLIDHQQTDQFHLCMTEGKVPCPNQLCLQSSVTQIECLSVDAVYSPIQIVNESIQEKTKNFSKADQVIFSFVKRFGYHPKLKILYKAQSPNSQSYVSANEPNLEEFSVATDDRDGDRLPLTKSLYI